MRELEAELKRNPDVVVQLLRLANSSAFGLGRQCLVAARGDRGDRHAADHALDATAALRGRRRSAVALGSARATGRHARALHGTGGAQCCVPSDEAFADAAFMTGIFSLVHVVLDMHAGGGARQAAVWRRRSARRSSRTTGALGALLRHRRRRRERGDGPAQSMRAGRAHAAFARAHARACSAKLAGRAATWFARASRWNETCA